ncbi:hypothetical protein MPER_01390 [Moniliophthora perniciosa FA553]|nr:hypothetical protein MPER_01390 [Moniliophthora perniciosa FA553]
MAGVSANDSQHKPQERDVSSPSSDNTLGSAQCDEHPGHAGGSSCDDGALQSGDKPVLVAGVSAEGLLKMPEEEERVEGADRNDVPVLSITRVTSADLQQYIEAIDEEDHWRDPVMEGKCERSLRYIIKHGPSNANLAKLDSVQCRYMRGHASRVPLSAQVGREVVEWIITTSKGQGEQRCIYHHWANKNKGEKFNDITALAARDRLRKRLAEMKSAARQHPVGRAQSVHNDMDDAECSPRNLHVENQ